jgi:phosphate transport system substrate-binding protein
MILAWRSPAQPRVRPLAGVLLLSVLCMAPLAGCRSRGQAHGALIIAGSTSVQPVAEYIAEFYQDENPRCVVNVQGGGSTAGVKAALDGAADIGMISRDLKKEEAGLEPTVIALDAVTLIVHPTNRVRDLTKQQVQDIYLGRVRNWSEIPGAGSPDAAPGRDAITVITREEGSGTRSAFEEGVMDKQDIAARALVQDSTGTVRAIVASDPNAIGYISLGMVTPDVKLVDYEGVRPSPESVHDRSYPLSRPFCLITKGAPSPEAQAYIAYALGPDGQKLVARAGYIPVGKTAP